MQIVVGLCLLTENQINSAVFALLYACSVMADSLGPHRLSTLWSVACQTPLSVEFSRQEYRNGLFPPPGGLHNPGVEPLYPVSLALAGGFFTTEPAEKLHVKIRWAQSPCSTKKKKVAFKKVKRFQKATLWMELEQCYDHGEYKMQTP